MGEENLVTAVTADLIANVEDWYDTYSTLSPTDRCDFIDQTLDYPLTEDFLEETEMSLLIAGLEDTVGPAAMVRLVDKLRRVLPEFHLKEVPYLEDTMLVWGLFHDDPEQIDTAAAYFRKNPVQFVDHFLMTFRWLCLYQKRDIALQQAEVGFPMIQASHDILPGAEDDLGQFLIFDQCERLYDQISSGQSPDPAPLAELEHQLYGDNAVDVGARAIPLLLDPTRLAPSPDWRKADRRPAVLRDLHWVFLRHQRDAKGFSFATSTYIWDSVFRLLEGRQYIKPDAYFYPTEQELDQYLGSYAQFLSLERDWAFITLWGIPYVADFLKNHGWMTTDEHTHCLSLADHLKATLIEASRPDLWKYAFVHRWTPPDSADPDVWVKEAQIFADSLTAVRSFDRDISPDAFDFLDELALPSIDSLLGVHNGRPPTKVRSTHRGRSGRKKPKGKNKNKKRGRH